jgi:hypothetical protein
MTPVIPGTGIPENRQNSSFLVNWGFSNHFRLHGNRTTWTLTLTQTATLAIVIVELEPFPGTELLHGIIGTNAVAVITFKTITTRHTTPCFIRCGFFIEVADDFRKATGTTHDIEPGTM